MEKTISVRRTTITFSIWDLGGQREFVNMLPLVCNDAVAILFMFDLSRKSTLNSVKEWYRQARGFNKVSMVFILALIQWSMSLCLVRTKLYGNSYWFILHRLRYLSWSEQSLIHLQPSPEMNKKRLQSRSVSIHDSLPFSLLTHFRLRQSVLLAPCTHHSSSVQHPRPLTCRRSSRSSLQKHSIWNASFRR